MILVRLRDNYVAPIYINNEGDVKNGGYVDCNVIGCQYLDYAKEDVCQGCNFNEFGKKKLEEVEVKFKFIEEEN